MDECKSLFTGSSLAACISVTGWASVAAAVLVVLVMREAGTYTCPLFSSTWAVSDTKYTRNTP